MGQLRTSLIRVALLCFGIYGFWTCVLQSGVHSTARSLNDQAQLTLNLDAYYFWTASPQGNIRQRLAEFRWYNESERWNRNVIQSWKTQLNVSDKNFASWEHFNPDFKHILFLDDTQDERVREIGSCNLRDVARTYFELFKKKFILRSDFFRYLAIWSDGGIWADVDTWAQRPFDEWISLALLPDGVETIASLESKIGMVVGIEYDRGNGGEWDGLCQYVFAAKQGHPVLLELIARIVEKAGAIANKLDAVEELNNREVLGITGPELFTEVVSQWIKQRFDSSFEFRRDWHEMTTATLFGDILVLPIWAFSSGRGFPDTGGFEDPRVCAGHGFAGSWVGKGGW